jgi:hypothetical protein
MIATRSIWRFPGWDDPPVVMGSLDGRACFSLPFRANEKEVGKNMVLFSRNKESKVRGLILKLVNTHCPSLTAQIEDARADNRVSLVMVVAIVPLDGDKIRADKAFSAVTKDFSSTGVAIVLEQPMGFDQVILGFRMGEEMTYVRAEAKHVNPMGGGFFQLGCRLLDVVAAGDYPGLASLRI